MTEVDRTNKKVLDLLTDIKEVKRPDLRPERFIWLITQLEEIFANLRYPCTANISFKYSKDGTDGTVVRMNVKVKGIKVLRTGWIVIKTEGQQRPPLEGWARDFYQITFLNSE